VIDFPVEGGTCWFNGSRWKVTSSAAILGRLGACAAGIYLDYIHEIGGYNVRMTLSASIEKLPEATAVVTLSGQMTLGTSLKVADSQIQGLITDGVSKLVIDLTGVDYMDSAGLGMLVYVFGTLREKIGELRLCGVSPRLVSLLKLTKTDTFLSIDATREESLVAIAE
jgi:anti-sigma B factor antagonist